ncbi:MAG TPA: NADP-dependent oxidoreductase [Pseudonocardia sp.]|jgi:NADPH:quinone reductase-like Zn-dependent oxidoreductase|nr:NADP-dependent oxidoreductase [Pseudonocardia sp.]
MRVRAVGFMQFGGPEVLEELDIEETHAGPGEVRVKVSAVAVSPSDTMSRSGGVRDIMLQIDPNFQFPPPPYIVGWDAAGVVDEIGPDTDAGLSVGDRVVAIADPMTMRGAYMEYLVVPVGSVVAAPSNVDDEAACTLPMNGLTARLALDKLALPAGSTIAVTGSAGTFGGYVVELAKADGLRVIADASEADEELVRKLGADVVVRRGPEVAKAIREVAPDGVDALVDGSVQDDAVLDAVRNGGAIVTVRNYVGPDERGISWIPIYVNEYLTDRPRLDALARQVEAGQLTLRVAGTYPAEKAAEAHQRMQAGGVRGRLVLTF